MEKKFDFSMINNQYTYTINENILLRIKQLSNSIAVLYFTDEIGNKINIPTGLVVYTYDFQNTEKKIIKQLFIQDYTLCWTNNYIIELHGNIVIDIKSQRCWNIVS